MIIARKISGLRGKMIIEFMLRDVNHCRLDEHSN